MYLKNHNTLKGVQVSDHVIDLNVTFSTKGGNWNLIISLGWSVSDHENEICCKGHLGDETWKK